MTTGQCLWRVYNEHDFSRLEPSSCRAVYPRSSPAKCGEEVLAPGLKQGSVLADDGFLSSPASSPSSPGISFFSAKSHESSRERLLPSWGERTMGGGRDSERQSNFPKATQVSLLGQNPGPLASRIGVLWLLYEKSSHPGGLKMTAADSLTVLEAKSLQLRCHCRAAAPALRFLISPSFRWLPCSLGCGHSALVSALVLMASTLSVSPPIQ